MDQTPHWGATPDPDAWTEPRLPDLETLVHQIGTMYPLMGYVEQDDDLEPGEAVDVAIFAGLVTP